MPRIRSALNLTELPAPSTLCKAFDRLDMAVWRVLLNLSVSPLPTNGVAGIDASGFDRSHASKHYTKRAKLTIQQLKVTLLVIARAYEFTPKSRQPAQRDPVRASHCC